MEVTHTSALIFLSSLLGCILLLLIINKIASKYLNGDFYKTDDSDDTEELDQYPMEIKIAKIKEEIEKTKSENLSVSDTRLSAKLSDDLGNSMEEIPLEKAPLRVKLTFEFKKNRIIGNVMSIDGLAEMGKCPSEISFQAKLVPMKRRCKGKTIWKSTKSKDLSLAFTFGPLKTNVNPTSVICVKLYGRKKGFRSKAVCIGQLTVQLSTVRESEGVLTIWKDLVPKSSGYKSDNSISDSSDFD